MQNSDYNTLSSSASPYYYPQSPNPDPIIPPSPMDPYAPLPQSYASAPPFSPTPQPPPQNYQSYPSLPDHHHHHTPIAPPPSYPQQPQPLQSSYSFPQFEPSGPHQYYPTYDQQIHHQQQPPSYNNNSNPVSQQYPPVNDQYSSNSNNNINSNLLNNFDNNRNGGYGDDAGVYAYKGSNEPYGALGTGAKSSTWNSTSGGSGSSGFDDFGRPIGSHSSSSSRKEQRPNNTGGKVVRAVPKVETTEGGVQKFRVKLLAESGGQSTMDVLCQIGLDGIRMLDPSTNRTLRIYLLDAITRCEAIDSSTFAFWSKSSVDIEPRRIRLQSNRYTTNTLLDTVTAAIVQYKEIGGTSKPYESPKSAEQLTEKKKGFVPWANLIKPVNEEKDHWVPDEAATKCTSCGSDFNAFNRRHHCRNCGDLFCLKCTQGRTALTADENAPVVRVCDRCLAEVTRRLSIPKESVSRSTSIQSHADLAKKLQEEMERSCKVSSGSRSEGSGKRMKEVACPTCTVHLQVQVPSSGSETIECGVCQHPFLVSSH